MPRADGRHNDLPTMADIGERVLAMSYYWRKKTRFE